MSRTDPRALPAGRPAAPPHGDVVGSPPPPVVHAPHRHVHRLLAPALLVLIVLAAVAVRIPELGQPLWGDEVAAARAFSHHDIHLVLASVRLRKNEPPLWYLLAWGIQRAGDLLGATPRAVDLRIVSLGASVLTVAGVFAYARRSLGLAEAVAAAAVTAFGAQFVLHGGELRGYALYSMLAVGFALLVEAAVRSDARRWLVLLALTTAAGCLTEYLFLLTGGRRRRVPVECADAAGAAAGAGRGRDRRRRARARAHGSRPSSPVCTGSATSAPTAATPSSRCRGTCSSATSAGARWCVTSRCSCSSRPWSARSC